MWDFLKMGFQFFLFCAVIPIAARWAIAVAFDKGFLLNVSVPFWTLYPSPDLIMLYGICILLLYEYIYKKKMLFLAYYLSDYCISFLAIILWLILGED